MSKRLVVVFLVLGDSIYTSSNADARGSHRRAPVISYHPLPGYYRNLASSRASTPTYSTPIYHQKDYTPPHIYTIDKPLFDDPQIYRPLNIQREYHPTFYKYDEKQEQYVDPKPLHADSRDTDHHFISVEVNGQILYYGDGLFYRKEGKHLIVVAPVMDSVVKKISESSRRIDISQGYYEHNGVYFRKVFEGYQVIGRPLVSI